MVILAWLLALGSCIAFDLGTCYGLGLHSWDITLEAFVKYWKVSTIGSTMCGISVMFSKLSILSLYLRFCQCRRLRMVIYTIMWVVAIYSVVSSFSFLYACRPMAKFWDPRIARGSCIRKLAIPVFNGIMNVVTDFFIVIIPIFIFWRVQISTRQRIGLVLMFMTGGFVVVISIIRLKTSIDIMHEIDISWHGAFVIMWWVVEMHVAIICTSLPNLKPFLRRHFPKVLGCSFRTSTNTNSAATPSRTVQQFHTGDVD
ncbi:hypothetical protein B0J12DRAFT_598673 [Macrophomina phaseolina]|uniref:Rhodopsin domain-containing protein n=1 Tax=Macrophomina phaseolina TaxID=35725 RepID=A0ABQ8GCH2_9PEZI|nr:hypothetical protein B0J12DRAFT_598673 [Macrophomina phaseolina]